MPIVRTYMCGDCGHHMSVTLAYEDWDKPPPSCPICNKITDQDFRPVAIGGSVLARANAITEDILDKDFNVSNIKRDTREGSTPTVTYKDQGRPLNASSWGIAKEALEGAIASGRRSRLTHGSGLDILQSNLKSGAQPDLIEISKRRAMKIW